MIMTLRVIYYELDLLFLFLLSYYYFLNISPDL